MNGFSNAAYLPPVSKPPHDPKRLPLNNRVGWRIAHTDKIVYDDCGHPALQLKPEAVRALAEPSGSLAGLVLPKHLAYTPDCGVLLLDSGNARLKKFDPCACKFLTVPLTGGKGKGPREFNDPAGIAICGDNVLVADKGNHRVVVYSLLGFLVRSIWLPPGDVGGQKWQPTAIAVSLDRQALVADPANGCIHVFNFAGRWLRAIFGVGAVEAIAVDNSNDLYVVAGSGMPVFIYDPATGEKKGEVKEGRNLHAGFPPLRIEVDPSGLVNLGPLCALFHGESAGGTKPAWFDAAGNAVSPPLPILKKYYQYGVFYTHAVDSQLYRCQWDRLAMTVDIPQGTSLTVSTFSAETELTTRQITELPESNWSTRLTLYSKAKSKEDWDCLIRSEPGRFIWLRIEMTGNGVATPAICRMQLDFPRISLARYLPAVFAEEPQSADFTDRFLEVFDQGFRQIETTIDFMAKYFDPLSAPAAPGKKDFLTWLATWIGITLDRQLPLPVRRNLVKNAAKMYPCRGTLKGLRRMLDLYLGFNSRRCRIKPACGPCTTKPPYQWQPPGLILEHFHLRRWLFVGSSRLGDQARLWGQKIVNRSRLDGPQSGGNARLGVTQLNTRQDPLRDPFHVYAHRFTVFLPAWVERARSYHNAIARVVAAEKPAHTEHHIVYVQPRFRVGIQSMIGFDSVIGCYPQGVTLGQVELGKGSVLSEQDYANSTVRIGSKSTIGTTMRLR